MVSGMKTVGIIPAAGKGARWGKYPKFLLPCGPGEWLLDRAIRQIPSDKTIIVFSENTLLDIATHVRRCSLSDKIILIEQTKPWDLYGAIHAALQVEADFYYMAMPDTYIPKDIFSKMNYPGITFGAFITSEPERFGVLRDTGIVDKMPGPPGYAWGCISWSKEVRDSWLNRKIGYFPDALNFAIKHFESHMVKMDFYYDMANWNSYKEFAKNEISSEE